MRLPFAPARSGPRAALAAVLVVAALLRFHGLASESFWLDEGFSARLARGGFLDLITDTAHDVHPPLYYLLLWVWIRIVGSSEAAIRSLSVLIGVATVALAWRIASDLDADAHRGGLASAAPGVRSDGAAVMHAPERPGLMGGTPAIAPRSSIASPGAASPMAGVVAATLLAVSAYHVEYSQEARMYALLGLVGSASMWMSRRFLFAPGLATGIRVVAGSALALYTHLYGLFVIAAQNLYVLVAAWPARRTFPWRQWIAAQILALVAFAPWGLVLAWQVLRVGGDFWIPEPTWEALPAAFLFHVRSPVLLAVLAILAVAGVLDPARLTRAFDRVGAGGRRETAPDAAVPGSSDEAASAVVTAADRDAADSSGDHGLSGRRERAAFLLIWIVAPVALPWLVSKLGSPIFLARYTIISAVAFYVAAALGLSRLRRPLVVGAVTTVLVALSIRPLIEVYTTYRKERWRDAVAALERAAAPGELVLFNAAYCREDGYSYYATRRDLVTAPFGLEGGIDPDPWVLTYRMLGGRDSAWLVLCRRDRLGEAVGRILAADFRTTAHWRWPGIEVLHYER